MIDLSVPNPQVGCIPYSKALRESSSMNSVASSPPFSANFNCSSKRSFWSIESLSFEITPWLPNVVSIEPSELYLSTLLFKWTIKLHQLSQTYFYYFQNFFFQILNHYTIRFQLHYFCNRALQISQIQFLSLHINW